MDSDGFDLNAYLRVYLNDPQNVPCNEADFPDDDNEDEDLSASQINRVLDPIIDSVAIQPGAVTKATAHDNIQFLLKKFSRIPPASAGKLLDVLTSGLSSEVDEAHRDIENEEQDSFAIHREILEIYGFLLQWAITATEARMAEKTSAASATRKGGKGGRSKAAKPSAAGVGAFDSSSWVLAALEVMSKVLKLKLSKIFITTSERDTFVSLFTRPTYVLLENEQGAKNTALRMHAFKVLCLAVKHHGHALGAQTSIIQSLSYFEHLAEPMAEFLQILSEQFDYPQLSDEILRELSAKEFNSNDTRGPKSVAQFLIRLSELSPRLVTRQITLLIKQLDSESYTLRCAVIEVCGNLILDLVKQDERTDANKSQIESFFDLLEERFLDVNPYCRSRLMQVMTKLCDLEVKNPKRRQRATELATRSLEDKSSNVRRNAIKLLGRIISTHPFGVLHGGQLNLKEWQARLEKVDEELNALQPPEAAPGLVDQTGDETTIGEGLLDDVTNAGADMSKVEDENDKQVVPGENQNAGDNPATSEAVAKLQLTRRYYSDAIQFIRTLHRASKLVLQLLVSKNKGEVVEAMDFFVILDAYKIETASLGIRKMLRLIWTKGNSDEGRSVQTHLIDCYKSLYFDCPETFNPSESANYIARNIISLTFGASSADLTSLEQLLNTMMKNGQISETVVKKLWKVYGIQTREISATQRRGSIICLGMLATADPDIVVKELETVLRIGLGATGRSDLALAKYTCVALKNIRPSGRKLGVESPPMPKLPNDHAVLVKLAAIFDIASESPEWYGLAEQAINAIYALSKHPDVLCTDIVRKKTKLVFGSPTPEANKPEEGASAMEPPPQKVSGTHGLCQLLFVVGHIAIKQIVHLEACEIDFKKRKALTEKGKLQGTGSPVKGGAAAQNEDENELDLIGGTNEDDFADAMQHIRERELLFGRQSLLSNFGPMVSEICASNMLFKDRNLQAAATLCMAKLMCVSAQYCEEKLPLLITIMERSSDPITRSNVVIALGDMAVCFNHLIDENTDFLYRRLSDKDSSVKRTCLMTLTFLILAGQVKVKGQLGEMAKCLEDGDKKISDLARMFFSELATKDNAVYNHFVDIFSLLTSDQNIDEETFKRIIKFLIAFIEKDKHAKQLSEKLAARLARCETERQWNDVAYALSLLQHKNEEIQKVVNAGYQIVSAAG